MVQLVSHRYQRSGVQPFTKAPRAYNGVDTQKQLFVVKPFGDHVLVLFKDFGKLFWGGLELVVEIFKVIDHVYILSHLDILFAPMTRELDLRQHFQVGVPIAVFALSQFEYNSEGQSQLLPIDVVILVEALWMVLDNSSKNWMLLRIVQSYHHFVRDKQESFSIFNVFFASDTEEPVFKNGGKFKFWH